ncbi:MAG: HEPN domain-containing protein [Dehalococcoidia bacterium]|nr:HEPN domain-containing protein [Dehalococcoidia bacterium]
MHPQEDARHRLRLAEGFLAEARQDVQLSRWRSCVDNSQLAAENAAKAPLAVLGPVGRTHAPAALLRRAIAADQFPQGARSGVERLAEVAEQLGWDVHMASDYGDEAARRTPWELFDESFARQALALAEEAVALARELAAAE